MNEEYKLETTEKLHINFKPSYTITMHRPDGEVAGKLDFNGPKLIFTGDAEESAKVFLDFLSLGWDKRLQEERESEREACAKVAESYEPTCDTCPSGVANAIRARGER